MQKGIQQPRQSRLHMHNALDKLNFWTFWTLPTNTNTNTNQGRRIGKLINFLDRFEVHLAKEFSIKASSC
ncbi:hypothetical protein ACLKA6_011522 [Drosophila palustris]